MGEHYETQFYGNKVIVKIFYLISVSKYKYKI